MTDPGAPSAPLDGILVADFSRVLAGPAATMMLADLGARVIKIERPRSGDDTRQWGPPYSSTGSTYFESVNRNKESIALDFASADDIEIARALANRADIVVENFRPGVLDSLGLGYAAIRDTNPGVVFASITGFGSAGGAALPGYDFIVQALGGLMSVTGDADLEGSKVGVALVDLLAGKDLVAAVLAALFARRVSGMGARLELNLLSSLQGALANQGQAYLGAGVVPGRLGNVHPSIAPYQTLRCADGELAVACGNDGQFAKLCATLDVSELVSDPRFATNPLRVSHRAELVQLLEKRLGTSTAADWEFRLMASGVPAGHIATIDEGIAFAESLGLRPTIEVIDRDGRSAGRQIRNPIDWTPAFPVRRDAPPKLDEDSEAIRAWLMD